jgi:hypothetical protein
MFDPTDRLTHTPPAPQSLMVQAAVKELGACSDIDMDDLKAALIKQAQQQAAQAAMPGGRGRVAVLGDVDLEGLNDCLRRLQEQQQGNDVEADAACQQYMDAFDAKAEAKDGSPGYKVASRLKHDPEAYCGCVGRINVDVGADCTGWGVVSWRKVPWRGRVTGALA